ncbi:MAG: sulfur globule family protein [Candidatus Thiodiazotropha lotti]|nr:sulfur globule family protein [Candidatus Thiodiazotropha lotti]MCW4218499.1 sulfur globule family protein [Candidatus Thiodiazotropha lotti]
MKKIALTTAAVALVIFSTTASAWWGHGPGWEHRGWDNDWLGDGWGWGDGYFSFGFSGSARGSGYGRGWNRYRDYYGPWWGAPYGYAYPYHAYSYATPAAPTTGVDK